MRISDFFVKMIKNGHREVKNSLVRKYQMLCVPGKRNQIMGDIIPLFS